MLLVNVDTNDLPRDEQIARNHRIVMAAAAIGPMHIDAAFQALRTSFGRDSAWNVGVNSDFAFVLYAVLASGDRVAVMVVTDPDEDDCAAREAHDARQEDLKR
jgi:hypothetical protein